MKCETPALRVGLVARAGADPEAERHRADARHPLGDQPLAGVELREDVLLHRWIVLAYPARGIACRQAAFGHGTRGKDHQVEAAAPLLVAERDPKRWWALALLCSAYFMVILDVSIVNVALPSIQEDLHFSPGDLQWVLSAYALTFGGFLLLGGRTADILGRRRVFMAGVALFTLASLACGLSTSEGHADRSPRGPGPRRGDPLAGRALDHHDHVRRGRRAEQGARDLGRDGRQRRRRRRAARRSPDEVARLGVDLLRQRPDRAPSSSRTTRSVVRESRVEPGEAALRRRRRRADHERALAPRLRAHAGEPRRLGLGEDDRRSSSPPPSSTSPSSRSSTARRRRSCRSGSSRACGR